MGQAVLGFLGVILGAAIAGGISLWQVQLVTTRERQARQAEQAQARKDTREAYQREAVLALQDAVQDYWELALDAFSRYHAAAAEGNPLEGNLRSIILPMNTAYSRLNMARAKVFDDNLRRLVKELDEQIELVSSPGPSEGAEVAMSAADALLTKLEERVNTLLRELF
jgi:hypothetical protein